MPDSEYRREKQGRKKVELREEKVRREGKKGKDEVQRKEIRKWPCQPQFPLDQGAQPGFRDAGQLRQGQHVSGLPSQSKESRLSVKAFLARGLPKVAQWPWNPPPHPLSSQLPYLLRWSKGRLAC